VKIAALVKQVVDVDQIKADKEGNLQTENLPLKISNYDKNAVEAAVQLKEKNPGTEVVAVATGPNIKDGVKEVLAMGCDRAVVLNAKEFAGSDNLATSRVLAKMVEKAGGIDLVLCGEGSLDSYTGLMGPRIAERLGGWPVSSFTTKLEYANNALRATSNLGGVMETLEMPLPAVVTVSEEINQPRLPPLIQILQAGRKPVQELKLSDLGLGPQDVGTAGSGNHVLTNRAPKMARKNIRLKGSPEEAAGQLAQALRKEGVI
jgi:electron transfer flavoprotein beta subunit